MTQKRNQQGFSAVEALLVIIILLLVGFIGYYVYHANNKAVSTYKAASTTAAAPTANKPDQKYLTIAEWNVKLPLTSGITDAYYSTEPTVPNFVYLSKETYKFTNCASDKSSLGGIMRFSSTDTDDGGSTYLSDYPTAKHIGSYYYSYVHPQEVCDATADNVTSAGYDDAAAQKTAGFMNEFKVAAAQLVTTQ